MEHGPRPDYYSHFMKEKTRLCELSTLPQMNPLVGTVGRTATPGSAFPEAAARNCFLALGIKLEKTKSFHPSELKKKDLYELESGFLPDTKSAGTLVLKM